MAQNTNSAAFIRLQPLQGNDIGSLVEEHVRYWRKYKDEQEADEMARQAAEEKFKRELEKNRAAKLPEFGVGEAQGYFRHQRVQTFQNEEEELSNLRQQYIATGDESIKLKLGRREEFYKNLNAAEEAFAARSKYILENKDKDFNPWLDQEIIDEHKALATGQYFVDQNGFNIYRPDGSVYTKAPEIFTAEVMGGRPFSGKPKFEETGKEIADILGIDVNDGNKILRPENRAAAISLWKQRILDNKLQGDSAFAKYKDEFGLSPDKEITPNQVNKVAERLFEDYTEGLIKENTNYLNNQAKKETMARGRQSDADKSVTLNLRTDEDGNPIKDAVWQGENIQLKDGEFVFGFNNAKPKQVVNEEGIKMTPTNILWNANENRIKVTGKDARAEPRASTTTGSLITGTQPQGATIPMPPARDVEINDEVIVGNVITEVINPETGRKFRNLAEAKGYFQRNSPTTTNQAEGDSIFD